jgi:hypothetical protein
MHDLDGTRTAALDVWWWKTVAILGGVLFLAWGYLHRKPDAVFLARTETPLYLRLLAFAVPVLFLTALIGLRVRLAAWMGTLERVGFVLAFSGSGLGAAQGALNTGPLIGPLNAYLLQTGVPYQLLGWLPPLLAGLVLVGTATVRTGALGRWSILPLVTGLCGWIYQLTDLSAELRAVHVAYGVLFAMCWMGLGWAVSAGQGSRE